MKKYLFISLLLLSTLHSASFDCNRATTKIEKALCSDVKLSQLDSQLGHTYYKLKKKIAKNKLSTQNIKLLREFFVHTQRAWVKNRNKWCNKYDAKELQNCLRDHYTSRIKKLQEFTNDGSFIYGNYKNILYRYTHVPYMQEGFKEFLDAKEYEKFLQEYSRWEESYSVCIDNYGVLNDSCTKRVAEKKVMHYSELLEYYENNRYLVEDANATLLHRDAISYTNRDKSEDEELEEESCYTYKFYKQKELKKLFHKDINSTYPIAEIEFAKFKNQKSCDAQESRFHFEIEQNIRYINKNVVVIESNEFSYSGGAHGDFESTFYNLDRNSAESISWEDIFGKEKKLYDFIMKKMRDIVLYTDYIKESDYYEMAQNSMHLSEDGIVIQFGVYEITTYDQGEPSFLIPLKLLKKTLSKEKYNYYFSQEKSVTFKVLFKK